MILPALLMAATAATCPIGRPITGVRGVSVPMRDQSGAVVGQITAPQGKVSETLVVKRCLGGFFLVDRGGTDVAVERLSVLVDQATPPCSPNLKGNVEGAATRSGMGALDSLRCPSAEEAKR